MIDGIRYRSRFEAGFAGLLKHRRISFTYERETILYEVPRVYLPDFKIRTASGKEFFVELKGYFPSEDRSKLAEVKRAHPTLDLRLIFQRADTRLSKAARAWSYGQWATNHNFLWADGTLPDAWMEE